jgi:sugar phosphate isomerase/epimerase
MAAATARLCLKARPTASQLADRLRPVDGVWPDGLELYLAAADLADPAIMDEVIRRMESHALPPGFALLIEGPVDSLDGADFDVTRESPADRLVLRRLADLTRRLNAKAVNIHVIAPSEDTRRLTLACHDELLRRCVPFLREFVDLVGEAGAVPTIENMPPVLRMRRGGLCFTPIGMASQDLLWLVDQVSGLAILADTSHAGLYLNARRMPADNQGALRPPRTPHTGKKNDAPPAVLPRLLELVQQLPEEPDLLGYIQALAPRNAQVSNASGLLGEGLPYDQGDLRLDPVIEWLGRTSDHLVTETLEPDVEDAVNMREALRRMRAVLA